MASRIVLRHRTWLLPVLTMLSMSLPLRADTDYAVLESARKATGFVFTPFGRMLSMGTAFCIDSSDGLFITNHHVISDKGVIGSPRIVLSPGTRDARILTATVVKADENLDLAILRVDHPFNLHSVELAGSGRLDRLRETQEVVALGYPLGIELSAAGAAPEVSVSTGKITALRHDRGILGLIQFDGSINHGNSGGPLLDNYGNVIGVVSAIIPNKQINFAIPASMVRVMLAEANIVISPPPLTDGGLSRSLINELITPPKGRRAIPAESAQQDIRRLSHDLFSSAFADKSKTGRENLVYILLDEANKEKADPVARYVLLNEAREAALVAGDLSSAAMTTSELMDHYDVEPMQLMEEMIRRIGTRIDGQDAADGATISLLLVEAMARQQLFVEARKWMSLTRAVAYAAHNSKVMAAINQRLARVENEAVEAEEGQQALAKLKINSSDPEANLAAGEYECFIRGDFAAGCPLLARSSNEPLRHVAEADLKKPATADDQQACGDLWWDASAALNHAPAAAEGCKTRAAYWYRLALPRLTGFSHEAAQKRLEEFDPEPAPNVAAASQPAAVAQHNALAAPPRETIAPPSATGGHQFHVTNNGDASEAGQIVDAMAEQYPLELSESAHLELVHAYNAIDFRHSSKVTAEAIPNAYGGLALVSSGSGPTLWGVYEKLDAGNYLVVYRLQAMSAVSGSKICSLDLCSAGGTIAEHRPTAQEFSPGKWSCMPVHLNLTKPTQIEFRLWPYSQAEIAVDRLYVFKVH